MNNTNLSYKSAIPSGYRIFFNGVNVAGASYRRANIVKAFSSTGVLFGLNPDPDNYHDENAIEVVAFKKGFFGIKKLLIGYIPKDIAKQLCDCELSNNLQIRIQDYWLGDEGGIRVTGDILGLKADYHKLKNK